jgi:hypothetical protein
MAPRVRDERLRVSCGGGPFGEGLPQHAARYMKPAQHPLGSGPARLISLDAHSPCRFAPAGAALLLRIVSDDAGLNRGSDVAATGTIELAFRSQGRTCRPEHQIAKQVRETVVAVA